MTERINRGSWRISETGELEEKEKADYAEQYEQEKADIRAQGPSVVKPEEARVAPVGPVAYRCRNNHAHRTREDAARCQRR
jgi:hypothetical protein